MVQLPDVHRVLDLSGGGRGEGGIDGGMGREKRKGDGA